MVEDVKIAVEGRLPVHFYGRTGGMVPTPDEIVDKAKEIRLVEVQNNGSSI